MTTTETTLFQQPASYWLTRAQRLKQNGDLIRAAVLERHAVRAEPSSDTARMSYALTLRQLHCYEASNREAFAALAHNPQRTPLLGLIGQNLFNLGMRLPGLDAMNLYASNPPDVPPIWQDEAYDMADAYDYPTPTVRRRARLHGLLQIAMRRTARGDLPGAKRALQRACKKPFRAPNREREIALALYFLKAENKTSCLLHLQKALTMRTPDVQTALTASSILHAMGETALARKLLLQSSLRARSPMDELLVCLSCEEQHMTPVALAMLRHAIARKADRFPVCYNLCAALLKLGRLDEAMYSIHLCREIDPDDVQGEVLFSRLQELSQASPTPAQVRAVGRSTGYYGTLTTLEQALCAQPVLDAAQASPDELARLLSQDDHLRRRFLFLLSLPMEWPAAMLSILPLFMDAENAIPLLRETLLQHPQMTRAKHVAMAALQKLGVPPPYLTWANGRIALADPTRMKQGALPFKRRVLTLRIHQALRLCAGDHAFIPWAMALIHRMNPAQRRHVIADHLHIWPLALALRYRAHRSMMPLRVDIARLGSIRLQLLREALMTIRRLERKDSHAHH